MYIEMSDYWVYSLVIEVKLESMFYNGKGRIYHTNEGSYCVGACRSQKVGSLGPRLYGTGRGWMHTTRSSPRVHVTLPNLVILDQIERQYVRRSAGKIVPFASRLSGSLRVLGTDTGWSGRSYLLMTSCFWSIVTMRLSRRPTFCEINGYFGRKTQTTHICCVFNAPANEVSVEIL